MARERAPATEVVTGEVAFEVERFEWTESDRLEVSGRWYGLRGHRFMRPALTIEAQDGRRRMLALLDHKPWAAEDGEPWVAAFPWEGEPVEMSGAELAVAPSLAVDLPAPRVPGRRRKAASHANGPRAARRTADEGAAAKQAHGDAPPTPGDAPPTPRAPADAPHDEVDALRAQLTAEQEAVRRVTAELDDARERLAAAKAATEDRGALERERDAAIAERDDARARAALDHDAVTEERDAAVRERAAAHQERDEALDQRAVSDWERKAALAERDAALAERDQAVEAHRVAVGDLEALERRVQLAEREPSAPAAVPLEPAERQRPRSPRLANERSALVAWGQRLAALVLLAAWAFVVYKVLHGVL
jgi:hypothetical protein